MLEKIQALKEDYISSLREDFDTFDALASELEFGIEEARTFEELRALVHRLAGSAGSFGFVELGTYARAIDQLLIESPQPSSDLSSLLSSLRTNFQAALR